MKNSILIYGSTATSYCSDKNKGQFIDNDRIYSWCIMPKEQVFSIIEDVGYNGQVWVSFDPGS